MSVDLYDGDLSLFNSQAASPHELQEHISYLISDARRKTDVITRDLKVEETKMMEEAKDQEVDQWISHYVFNIV